jgi:hypothetical protein
MRSTLGKKMKITIRLLLLLVALVVGCRERSDVVWNGSFGFNFNGTEIELPDSGKGLYSTTPTQLEYQWQGKALTIRDLGDKTVSVTTPAVTNQIVDKSLVIMIDSEGNITTRTPKASDEDKKTQQAAPRNR